MDQSTGIVYLTDGSFEGALCSVFESYSAKEIPAAIYTPDSFTYTLYPVKKIETERGKFLRVLRSIEKKISPLAQELVALCFLSCAPDKELMILRFLRLGYEAGPSVTDMLQEDAVCALHKAVRFLRNEAHLLTGFVRFCEVEGGLVSVIGPKNNVLPLLLPHFADRYPEENFLIHDRTHGLAAIHHGHQSRILAVDKLELPQADRRELDYRLLWKRYYDTIAIEGRYNPLCRRTHCPNRYWDYMLELSGLAPDGSPAFAGPPAAKQIPTAMGR